MTNGELMNRDVMEQCRRTGMNTVIISVDDLKETHEHIMRGGSLDLAIRSLSLFKEAGASRWSAT